MRDFFAVFDLFHRIIFVEYSGLKREMDELIPLPLFYAVGASKRLDGNRERIDELHLAVLTKNERLIVATMLLHNFAMRNF